MSEVRILDPQPLRGESTVFKIVKQNKRQAIINSDNQVLYAPPKFIAFKGYDLNKLLVAMNKKGYRDIEDVIAFESGKLK